MSKAIEISDRAFEFMQMVEQMDSIDMEFLKGMFPDINADEFASFLRDANIIGDETANSILQQLVEAETKATDPVPTPKFSNIEGDQKKISDYLANSLTEIYWSEVEVSRAFATLSELAYDNGLKILLYNYGIAANNRVLMIEDGFGWVTRRSKTPSREIIQQLVLSGREAILLLGGDLRLSTLRMVSLAKLITDYQEMLYQSILLNLPKDISSPWGFVGKAAEWFNEYERQLSLVGRRYRNFNENRRDEVVEE